MKLEYLSFPSTKEKIPLTFYDILIQFEAKTKQVPACGTNVLFSPGITCVFLHAVQMCYPRLVENGVSAYWGP